MRGRQADLDRRALRKRCSALLSYMDLSAPFTARQVCERLAERRGRPIRLEATPMPPSGPYGLCLATSTEDIVLYAADTSLLHQEQIIYHEAVHIWAEHRGHQLPGPLPELNPETVEQYLQRSSYEDHDEFEAEAVGSMLLRIGRSAPRPAASPEVAGVVDRLTRSLEHGPM